MSRIKPFRQFEHDRADPPEHVAYLVHLDPPYVPEGCEDDRSKWVCHYLGSTETWRLLVRIFTDHGTVNGARVLQVQREAGGTWHLVRTWAGGRDKEVQLKQRSGTSYCPEPQCAGEHARPGSSRPTGRYRTRRQRAAAQRAREAREASPVRAARETTYEEMQQQFRSSKEISEEAFWELEPHIERLEAQWRRELRERETQMPGRQSRAAAREYAQHDAGNDAPLAQADRPGDLAGPPGGYRQEITAARAARIRAQLGADLILGDPGQLAAVPEREGPEASRRETDELTEPVQAPGDEPGPDAARWTPRQDRDEAVAAGELLSEHVARAEDAWRRERRATAGEHLAGLAHDEQALSWARQDAELARAARESATRGAYAAAADMQRSALGTEHGDAGARFPQTRVLETSPASLAPLAATLPDGTPQRGWQAQGGLYVCQAQAQAEAG